MVFITYFMNKLSLQGDGGDADGELEAKLRHSFIDIMKRFDLRNYLTPELKTQFAKSEEKNHFDQKLKTDKHEQVGVRERHSEDIVLSRITAPGNDKI